jgi:hypothetical protein
MDDTKKIDAKKYHVNATAIIIFFSCPTFWTKKMINMYSAYTIYICKQPNVCAVNQPLTSLPMLTIRFRRLWALALSVVNN